ncbi:MAG: LamB/YcsF family protein [Verrucomicrobiota bacterium]
MAMIDLNADVGEGFDDESLLPSITSCNIACGAHAGDAKTMKATLEAALRHGVACGAHPGYPDRRNFGRVEVPLTLEELASTLGDQLAALEAAARPLGARLRHVKPHGALYHVSARRRDVARAIAEAVARRDTGCILVGYPGSALLAEGERAGLRTAAEGFADRLYLADGNLAPRSLAGSVHSSPEKAAEQALAIVRDRCVTAPDGTRVPVEARTICLHGDTPGAAMIAKAVRRRLEEAGIEVRSLAS